MASNSSEPWDGMAADVNLGNELRAALFAFEIAGPRAAG
jgi:hypothetical protein